MSSSRRVALAVCAVVAAAGAGCGFDCEIQDEREHFADCEALQARVDEEQDAANPDNAVVDDLLVCADVVGCEVEQ